MRADTTVTFNPRAIKDRRHNPRKRTVGSVFLSWAGRRSLHCHVIDLSSAGAFVDVGRLRVPTGAIVELAFVHHAGKVIGLVRRSAVVVRRSPEGLGLMFVWRRRHRLI
jgi:hypothetical protein